MIRHILLIQFKDETLETDLENVKQAFKTIPDHIEGIMSVEWGENISPEHLNMGFTHCIQMTFQDKECRDQYLPHPKHEELKSVFINHLKKIIVFDYSIL